MTGLGNISLSNLREMFSHYSSFCLIMFSGSIAGKTADIQVVTFAASELLGDWSGCSRGHTCSLSSHHLLLPFTGIHFPIRCLPDVSVVKMPLAHAGDAGLIPGSGRSLGERNGNPLQYSCLGSPMDRGAWQATVHGVAKKVRRDLVTEQPNFPIDSVL